MKVFLEVKKKQNDSRTEKHRIRIESMKKQVSEGGREFIEEVSGFDRGLTLSLLNRFKRITLVHKVKSERFTIDSDLSFARNGQDISLPQVVIAEIKQSRASCDTESFLIMRQLGIRPMGISKYCLGSMLLQPELKSNNFRAKRLYIEKL